jgi:two-component system response regulator FlrC
LAERFVARAQTEHGKRIRDVEPTWYERLEAYAWPGNIRELRNAVEAAVVTAPGEILEAARLRLEGTSPAPASGGWSIPVNMTLEQIEKKILEEALRRNGGNRSLTAEQLGLSRRTIQRKIQDYQLPF